MARPLRIEYEGAFYHVTARGNERKKIFYSRGDYEKLKSYLKAAIEKYDYRLHCYVHMPNHYHLLIETPKANLSKIIHYINCSYSNYINLKENRSGHLFQGRYKAILVDSDSYLLELSRYLHLNPVRAKIVERPEDYPYSSYRIYISEINKDIVTCNLILDMIGKSNCNMYSKQKYKEFVEYSIGKNLENPFEKAKAGVILGSKRFVSNILIKIKKENLNNEDISHRRALKSILDVEDVFSVIDEYFHAEREDMLDKNNLKIRNIAIYLLKKYTDRTNKEIGDLFGNISYSAVAKANKRFLKEMKKDSALRKNIEEIITKIQEMPMSNVKT